MPTRCRRSGWRERTGRTDVCALPYGINTVSLFAHVFLVMLPAKLLATAAGVADPARVAWQAGLFATLSSGIIELAAAPIAERVRKATPRAALLSTLAGIALSFISLGFLYRTFARPLVGLTTLAIVMLTYFGRVRFKGRLPGGVLAAGATPTRPTAAPRSRPTAVPLAPSTPAALGLDPQPLERLGEIITGHLAEGRYPGAQIAVARRGQLALFRTFGDARLDPTRAAAREDTLWLMYSNTKATTARRRRRKKRRQRQRPWPRSPRRAAPCRGRGGDAAEGAVGRGRGGAREGRGGDGGDGGIRHRRRPF